MIIFTEVLQHGTLPWTAEHDRRSILWRYSPGNMSFHPSGYSVKEHSFQRHWSEHLHRWPAEWYEGLDEEIFRQIDMMKFFGLRKNLYQPVPGSAATRSEDT